MPEHILHLTESALAGKTLAGARNTPVEPFFEAAGAEVAMHDPWVDPGLRPPGAEAPDPLPVFRQRSENGLNRKHAANS